MRIRTNKIKKQESMKVGFSSQEVASYIQIKSWSVLDQDL